MPPPRQPRDGIAVNRAIGGSTAWRIGRGGSRRSPAPQRRAGPAPLAPAPDDRPQRRTLQRRRLRPRPRLDKGPCHPWRARRHPWRRGGRTHYQRDAAGGFPGWRSRRAPRPAVARTRLRRGTVSGCFYRSWWRHIRPRGPCPGAAGRRGRLARLPPPAPDDRQWHPNPRARRLRPRAGSTATPPSIGRRQRRPTKTGCRNDRTHNTRTFGEPDTAACAGAPGTRYPAGHGEPRQYPNVVQRMQKTLLCGITSSYINFLKEIF
jgi:hypothetical protein